MSEQYEMDLDVDQDQVGGGGGGGGGEVLPFRPPGRYEIPSEGVMPQRLRINTSTTPIHDQVAVMEVGFCNLNRAMTVETIPGSGVETVIQPQVYRRYSSTSLVRIEGDEACVLDIDAAGLSVVAMNFCQPTRMVMQAGVNTEVAAQKFDGDVIRGFIQMSSFSAIPPLNQVVDAPLITPDGVVRWQSGYDVRTGRYVRPRAEHAGMEARWAEYMDGLDQERSRERAEEAGRRLLGWFSAFGYEYPEQAVDAMGAALTPWLLPMLEGQPRPLTVTMATDPGSGKSKLAELIFLVGGLRLGKSDEVVITSFTGEKDQNFITKMDSVAMDGTRGVFLDNVRVKLGGQIFESLLTNTTHSVRVFRKQTHVSMPWNTMMVAAINTPTVTKDMERRIWPIQMRKSADISAESVNDVVREVQGRLENFDLHFDIACLISHWVSCGSPRREVAGVFGRDSFMEWAGVIAGILWCVGIEGFGERRDLVMVDSVVSESDGDAEVLDALLEVVTSFEAWNEAGLAGLWEEMSVMGESLTEGSEGKVMMESFIFSTKQLWQVMSAFGNSAYAATPELASALLTLKAMCKKPGAQSLGSVLNYKVKSEWVGGDERAFRLEKTGKKHGNVTGWKLFYMGKGL